MKLDLPPVIFGTSGLGNLFVALDDAAKFDIIKACVHQSKGKVVFDTAGKYGAGLALEMLGKYLGQMSVAAEDIIISNKLGWMRTALTTAEPTFEPGVWKDLQYDAVQKISYDGIMACFEQGNKLLNGYMPQMVSVHDPDEYIAAAKDDAHAVQLYNDILDAYKALHSLKQQGKVSAIGVGAKNWRIIQRIAGDVALDWAMIANSMTIKMHPQALINFIKELDSKGVYVINSAVFHSGFLVGGDYFDYKLIEHRSEEDNDLFQWRKTFFDTCKQFDVKPAEACVQFALHVPGVKSVALNTTSAKRVKENLAIAEKDIPILFWNTMADKDLIAVNVLPWFTSISVDERI